MSDDNAVEVIKGAREILQRDGWFGGGGSPHQGGSCLYLALCRSYDEQYFLTGSMQPACKAVYEALRRQGYQGYAMVRWNDTVAQTPQQVDDILAHAEQIAAGG